MLVIILKLHKRMSSQGTSLGTSNESLYLRRSNLRTLLIRGLIEFTSGRAEADDTLFYLFPQSWALVQVYPCTYTMHI